VSGDQREVVVVSLNFGRAGVDIASVKVSAPFLIEKSVKKSIEVA
jgi:hypothetical protein